MMHALTAPVDANGFVTSFDIADHSAISLFFEQFGFVIIRDVLSKEDIEDTLDEFYQKFNFQNNNSFESLSEELFASLGIVGEGPDLKSRAQLNNRQNPNVHRAFATILKNNKLIVDHDRLGVMRPTFHNNHENVGWRTKPNWLHLDCNPNNGGVSVAGFARKKNAICVNFDQDVLVQGLIALTTAYKEDGGFHCVPGSHKFSRQWAAVNRCNTLSTTETMNVPQHDILHNKIQKIPLREGSLVVWNSLLFHGNFPNHSENCRIVQYVRFTPADSVVFGPLAPTVECYPSFYPITNLGKKLFGLENYKARNTLASSLMVIAGVLVVAKGISW